MHIAMRFLFSGRFLTGRPVSLVRRAVAISSAVQRGFIPRSAVQLHPACFLPFLFLRPVRLPRFIAFLAARFSAPFVRVVIPKGIHGILHIEVVFRRFLAGHGVFIVHRLQHAVWLIGLLANMQRFVIAAAGGVFHGGGFARGVGIGAGNLLGPLLRTGLRALSLSFFHFQSPQTCCAYNAKIMRAYYARFEALATVETKAFAAICGHAHAYKKRRGGFLFPAAPPSALFYSTLCHSAMPLAKSTVTRPSFNSHVK
ncbi:MAG: hypothetical protein HP053_06155 [Christensenellaceae bacterium]|nr:hypothetical protein [Christensenellaceae bacterium]